MPNPYATSTLAELARQLAATLKLIAEAERTIKTLDAIANTAGKVDVMSRNAKALIEARQTLKNLQNTKALIEAAQNAKIALEEANRLKKLKEGCELLYESLKKPKPVVPGLTWLPILIVFAAGGYCAWMLWEADKAAEITGQNVGSSLGQPNGLGANGAQTNGLSGSVLTSLDPQRIVTYKLVKTRVSKQLPGEAPQESEASGAVTSVDLATSQPGYTSTGTLTVKVPPTIAGDQQLFTVGASLAASWNLRATVYNVNVGVNVIGSGKHNAKGDPHDAWPTAGSHALSVENTRETSFATDGTVRKWTENGKSYRSFSIGGHTGVIQTLSGGNLTFIYEEVDSAPSFNRENVPAASSTPRTTRRFSDNVVRRFSGNKVFTPGDGK